MKRFISLGVLISLLTMTLPPASEAYGRACGIERWSVKTIADTEAPRIKGPLQTTVATLRALPAPANPDTRPRSRFSPVELTLFALTVQLDAVKIESDGDYHLVISDPNRPKQRMIAEIPASYCVANARVAAAFHAARHAIRTLAHVTPRTASFTWLDRRSRPVLLVLHGVGFFDRLHDQLGVAPNGIELHPVIGVSTP